MASSGVRARNVLLGAMLSNERAAPAVAAAVAYPLEPEKVIFDTDDAVDALCFPIEGVISLTISSGERVTEVAMVGREGFLGVPAYLGHNRSIVRATVQQPGTSFLLRADRVRALAAAEPRVAEILNGFVAIQLKTLAQSSFCRSAHLIEQQVARWLLMCLDRVSDDRLEITHGALGRMLGVRRASITEVAKRLQSHGIIDYHLGSVTIRDREKLEKAACSCYGAIREFELAHSDILSGR